MNDDEWARDLMADPGIGSEPPSKVDAFLAVRHGRRRVWMRRSTIAVTATATAVLAVTGLPLIMPAATTGPPPLAETLASPSAAVPNKLKPPTPPTECRREPLDLPPRATAGRVVDGDPSGRYAVGVAYIDEDEVPVLWDGTRPTVLGKPNSGHLLAMAVNASGTVVMSSQTESGRLSWIYRDGRFTEFPAGWSAVAINSRGDVAAAWLDDKGNHPPMVWLEGNPGNQRQLSGGDAGDGFVAAVGGIDDDGTVVGTTARWVHYDDRSSPPPTPPGVPATRAVYWPASSGQVRQLPTPDGFGSAGFVTTVRSGLASGYVNRIDPDSDRRGSRAVLWDLAAGTVTVDDRLAAPADVTPYGWMVGTSSMTPPAPPAAVFGGNLVPLPMAMPVAPDSGGGVSISDDGRVIVGSTTDNGGMRPVRWICA